MGPHMLPIQARRAREFRSATNSVHTAAGCLISFACTPRPVPNPAVDTEDLAHPPDDSASAFTSTTSTITDTSTSTTALRSSAAHTPARHSPHRTSTQLHPLCIRPAPPRTLPPQRALSGAISRFLRQQYPKPNTPSPLPTRAPRCSRARARRTPCDSRRSLPPPHILRLLPPPVRSTNPISHYRKGLPTPPTAKSARSNPPSSQQRLLYRPCKTNPRSCSARASRMSAAKFHGEPSQWDTERKTGERKGGVREQGGGDKRCRIVAAMYDYYLGGISPSSTQTSLRTSSSPRGMRWMDTPVACLRTDRKEELDTGGQPRDAGMLPRSIAHLSRVVDELGDKGWAYTVEGRYTESGVKLYDGSQSVALTGDGDWRWDPPAVISQAQEGTSTDGRHSQLSVFYIVPFSTGFTYPNISRLFSCTYDVVHTILRTHRRVSVGRTPEKIYSHKLPRKWVHPALVFQLVWDVEEIRYRAQDHIGFRGSVGRRNVSRGKRDIERN
ncbi:hypothetical protein C8J57DRAFT_1470485 [Mycena rebaudengoi]|nr:hypothetical protein C8J57DRAFT_1470485 [Mycena rebaudengoi]